MKALSIRQPWLWAILFAGKRIENRRWNTFHRGPILLHASLGGDETEHREALNWMAYRGLARVADCPPFAELPRGGIVARARLLDVVAPPDPPCPAYYPVGIDARWHVQDQHGFVLVDVEPVPFVPWPGALNLFHVPDNYAATSAPPGRIARAT